MRARLRNMPRWKLAAIAAAVVALAGAGVAAAVLLGGDDDPASTPRQASDARGDSSPGKPVRTTGARRSGGPKVAAGVSLLVNRMPVERKVAQLFLLGFQGQDLTAPIFQRLRELDLAGIVIDAPNYASPDQLAPLAGEAGVIADQEGHVAPWVMAPQEGGEFNAFPDLPPATAAADLRSARQAFDEAEQAASRLGDLGVNGVLAPVVDVAPAESIALGPRAYSDDPRNVSAYAVAVVEAYRTASVLTAAGHFPGLGSGTEDTRLGPSQVSSTLDDLRANDLAPFRAAIRAGVPAVLISNGLYVTDDFVTPGSLSRALMTDLLRDDLGFEGIAITDDLADPPVTALTSIPDAAVRAVRAGADLLYVSGPPAEQQAAYEAVLRAVRDGRIDRARLDEALLRGLSVKRDYGLVE
jgi:beta-N-acetylhexosaminidase